MNLMLRLLATLCAALFCLFAQPAFAQMPEGPPLPSPDTSKNATHSLARLGYYTQSSLYRYQGEYNITYNAFQIGTADLYGLIDADIEAFNSGGDFSPNRLVGTLEVGIRQPVHRSPIGIFYRHQSSHNVDLTDRSRPAWEQLGLRYQYERPRYDISLSVADYTHHEYCYYRSDVDLQGTYRFGNHGRNPLSIVADIHTVGEDGGPRSGFTDYWIEPNIGLSKTVNLFVGYGSTHDVDTANGISSSSVMLGLKFIL